MAGLVAIALQNANAIKANPAAYAEATTDSLGVASSTLARLESFIMQKEQLSFQKMVQAEDDAYRLDVLDRQYTSKDEDRELTRTRDNRSYDIAKKNMYLDNKRYTLNETKETNDMEQWKVEETRKKKYSEAQIKKLNNDSKKQNKLSKSTKKKLRTTTALTAYLAGNKK